jgi:APA family basic amino acid/polyamine antiporter
MKNQRPNVQISRKLGVVSATAIVIANMIGTGILTTSGLMAEILPNAFWVIGCWFLGGLIALSGALCYSELATRMPEEGGEYVYLKRIYHPSLGFLTGWTSFFVGFSAPIAASALSFVEYLFAGLNIGDPASSYELIIIKKSIAVSVIFLFIAIHYLGLYLGALVQNILTFIKVVLIGGIAFIGYLVADGHGNLDYTLISPDIGMGIGIAMMLVMFSYSGWNASSYIAGELKNPSRTLPVSLILGTLIVMILYLSLNIFIFNSLTFSESQGTIAVVEAAAVKAFGDWMGDALGIIISIALLSSLSAFILIGPRVYFAMARDKMFFKFAAKVHPRYKVPGYSIIIQGGIAMAMVVIGSFEQLLIYIGFALNVFPWLAIIGLFFARRKKIGEETVVKVRGYPLVPLFYLFSSLLLMIIAYIHRPLESTAAILTIVSGIPIYFLWENHVRKKEKGDPTPKVFQDEDGMGRDVK